MILRSTALAVIALVASSACAGPSTATTAPATPTSSASPSSSHGSSPSIATGADAKLDSVKSVHGGAGPWAVAGYRMGEHALHVLGLPHGSFDLEVVHFTPREVQYSCIADGAAAATGASLGKLNLTLAEAAAPETHTTYRRKSTGQAITLRPSASFAERFANVPRGELAAAGRAVLTLRDDEIFEVVAP